MASDDAGGAGGAGAGAGAGAAGAGGAAGDAGAGAGAGASAGAEKPFYEAFTSDDLKTHPTLHRYKSGEDLAAAHVNLEKRFGVDPARRIDLPADMSDPKAMREVYAKLGLPEKPDGYGFKLDDKATDDDKAFLSRAAEALHAEGLPPSMAKGVFNFWMKETQAAAERTAAAAEAERAEGEAAVRKAWGGAYDSRAKEVGNFLLKHFGEGIAKALTPEKLGNHPELAIGLGNVLDAMAEPGNAGGRSDESAQDGRALTPAQANAEIRKIESDPELAKALHEPYHARHKEVVERRKALLRMT